MQMAISRQNEFQADRTGAEISGRPLALAGALRSWRRYAHRIPMAVNPAAAQLAIVNPLAGARGQGLLRLFSTHPSTEERVARLRAPGTGAGLRVAEPLGALAGCLPRCVRPVRMPAARSSS